MKKEFYNLVITANKKFQPTPDEIRDAISSLIDKKYREASPDDIPRKGSSKIELFYHK